jgi:hypothetical protein
MSVHKDRIVESTLHQVATGDAVLTSDGEQIGTVAEVAHGAIKVDAPLHPSFWIEGDYVVKSERGRTALTFERKDLGAYRMDAPRRDEDPAVELEVDRVISEREQMETRLRMERELAEQREALPHMHPAGADGPPDTFGTIGEPVEAELERADGRATDGPDTVATGGIANLAWLEEPDTKATGGIARLAWLWLAGAALLGVVGAMAWRWQRSRR